MDLVEQSIRSPCIAFLDAAPVERRSWRGGLLLVACHQVVLLVALPAFISAVGMRDVLNGVAARAFDRARPGWWCGCELVSSGGVPLGLLLLFGVLQEGLHNRRRGRCRYQYTDHCAYQCNEMEVALPLDVADTSGHVQAEAENEQAHGSDDLVHRCQPALGRPLDVTELTRAMSRLPILVAVILRPIDIVV